MFRANFCMENGLRLLFGAKPDEWEYSFKSLRLTTPIKVSYDIMDTIVKIWDIPTSPETTIWDMFAGIGRDSVTFLKAQWVVHSSEQDPATFSILEKNMVSHTDPSSQYTLYNVDCTTIDIVPTICYMDPPWGPTFLPNTNFDFSKIVISGIPVLTIIRELLTKVQYLVIKTPWNCDTLDVFHSHVYENPERRLKVYFIRSMSFKNDHNPHEIDTDDI